MPTFSMPSTLRSTLAVCVLFLLGVLGLASRAAAFSHPQGDGRVIVLGFDGADARTVEELMARGQLPNLARLREQGMFAPLGTTNPAESPVAWASLNSGMNPAKTNIPGFVARTFWSDGSPAPAKGFAEDAVMTPVEDLPGAPIPTWSPLRLALTIGISALVVFLLTFGLLLRLSAAPTWILSLALAFVGAWGGYVMRSYLPNELPVVKNPLKAAPFWEVAAAAGVPTRVYDGQQAWDREPVPNAKVLCGLGVPDARGSYTSFFIYTTDELFFARKLDDPGADTGSGGYKLRVDERDGVIESEVFGPENFWARPRLEAEVAAIDAKVEAEPNMAFKKSMELEERKNELKAQIDTPTTLPMRIEKKEGGAAITIGAQTQTVALGEWSDWFHLTFELNPLLKAHAITRAKLVSLAEPFELFLNTIEIDPAKPPFWQPISQPADFSVELVRESGAPFETIGWACLTHPLKDDVIDAVTFLQDIEFTTRWREKLIYAGLAKDDWRLFVGIFSEADRVQHMMYQHYDEKHPLHDPVKAAHTTQFYGETIALKDAIPAAFRQVDKIVGKVVAEHLRPGDTLILCADHGFQSFRRQVHINNWLAHEGYLTLRDGKSGGSMLSNYVDWSRTRAYALGLGTIYINTKGQGYKGADGQVTSVGIVEPGEADALAREIAQKFLAATDPDTGAKIGSSAHLVKEIHSGPYMDREADLSLGFAAEYRVSWTTSSGGYYSPGGKPGPFVSNNDKAWSGDHVSVDTELVRGIFFSNRKCEVPAEGGVDLLHIAPTVLSALGVALPDGLDRKPLELR
jgi:predicted AlkP superfamily phosphohydrolase/phosphomutase